MSPWPKSRINFFLLFSADHPDYPTDPSGPARRLLSDRCCYSNKTKHNHARRDDDDAERRISTAKRKARRYLPRNFARVSKQSHQWHHSTCLSEATNPEIDHADEKLVFSMVFFFLGKLPRVDLCALMGGGLGGPTPPVHTSSWLEVRVLLKIAMTAWRATQVIVFGTSTRLLSNFATMSRVCKFGRFGGWHWNDGASIKPNRFVELANISGFDTDQRISYSEQNAIC